MPFCSDRCRIIDLGNWASEKYVISTPVDPQTCEMPEEDERLSAARARCSPPGSVCGYVSESAGHRGLAGRDRDRLGAARIRGVCRPGRSRFWRRAADSRRRSGRPDVTARETPAAKIRRSWWSTKWSASGSRWPAPRTLNWKSWLAAFAAVPAVRYLEAAAGAATGTTARRTRASCRRRDGRSLRRACVVRGWMVQSVLAARFMALRKNLRIPSADFRRFPACGHPRRRVPDPRQGLGRRRSGPRRASASWPRPW